MQITPDGIVIWQWGIVSLNATILFSWLVMLIMVVGSFLITRRLTTGPNISRFQNLLEIVVQYMQGEIGQVARESSSKYLPFIGTVFLFIAVCNLLDIVPFYQAPTGSLSTAAALAACVFVAVPAYGIGERGFLGYLKFYVQPSVFMLPFNIMGELSRTLALAVRLFGNIMSGTMIVGILLAVSPLIFPVIMRAFGLLTGMIQAYIFAVLTTVYIGAAVKRREDGEGTKPKE